MLVDIKQIPGLGDTNGSRLIQILSFVSDPFIVDLIKIYLHGDLDFRQLLGNLTV